VSGTAAQQMSLRRIAALVATGAGSAEIFAAIAREVGAMLQPRSVQIFRWESDETATVVGAWGPAGAAWPWDDRVAERLRGGRPARIGDAVGAPIVVDGALWGHISVEAPPDGAEAQLQEIAELVAAAIASSTTREQLQALADEQSALRRVAMLVAGEAPPADVFDAVAAELGRMFAVSTAGIVRYEDETAVVVARWGRLVEIFQVGDRLPVGGHNAITQVRRTGRTARVDDFDSTATGAIADRARRVSTSSSLGAAIMVSGRLWGAVIVSALQGEAIPPGAERRLEQFVELVGTAIANTQARTELARLADEQAALRRVATLVAEEAPPAEVFERVGLEVAGVLGPGVDHAILRYEPDETATVMAATSTAMPGGIVVGERLGLDGSGVTAQVYRKRRVVRVDHYAAARGDIADHASRHGITCAIGCPIVVTGTLWGSMVVAHHEPEPFPPGTEAHVQQFTDLVATAIANAQAREDLRRLVDEQAALRRVATLVAQAPAPAEVFDAVIAEVAQLLGAQLVGLMRYEGTEAVTIVARRGHDPEVVQVGMRLPIDGESVSARVLRTGQSTRLDLRAAGSGPIAELAVRSKGELTVGAPVTVEGRIWGVMTASWGAPEVPPADAEERLNHFAELLGTAIANADGRDQLAASRARVLSAADDARRQVVRDLHDGAQQRLVHTVITLKLAERALRTDPAGAAPLVAQALQHAEDSNAELRELAHGLLPSVLTLGGLRAGVDAVAERLNLPVAADITATRLTPEIEASAYFIVAEALTNVVKHAQATRADVCADVADGTLRLEVRDDGVGGADPAGHGLLGIGDRVAALGGRLRIDSPPGAGTVLAAELPLSGSG